MFRPNLGEDSLPVHYLFGVTQPAVKGRYKLPRTNGGVVTQKCCLLGVVPLTFQK